MVRVGTNFLPRIYIDSKRSIPTPYVHDFEIIMSVGVQTNCIKSTFIEVVGIWVWQAFESGSDWVPKEQLGCEFIANTQ